ncbi:hypothetical protein [Dasania marina]|uniref:hypothetical protein n=1 Tax=Dasania marina TaxID=471499 RepID=UPI00036C1DC6|nr:hypothetical protein [Dasania marina]
MKGTSLLILLLAILLPVLAAYVDVLGGSYPTLAAKLNTKILIGEIVAAVAIITLVPTAVVSWLKSSRGALEFSALGIHIKGPAAPILYWVLIFVAVSATVIALLGIFHPQLGTELAAH